MTPSVPGVPVYAVCRTGTPVVGGVPRLRRSGPPPPPVIHNNSSAPNQKQAHPTWLAQHIADTRRTASPDTCPRCGADTLTGPDHDTVAATVHLDPRPVDALTEVVALLTGRHTYQLTRNRIEHREPENIHAALNDKPIHVNHKCASAEAHQCLF